MLEWIAKISSGKNGVWKLLLTLLILVVALLWAVSGKHLTSKEASGNKIENSTINSNASTNLNIKDSVIQNGNGNNVVKNAK